jgi:hypothetical protein
MRKDSPVERKQAKNVALLESSRSYVKSPRYLPKIEIHSTATPLQGELELELIQTQMSQKPMLRAEEECACVAQTARARIRGAWVPKSLTKSEALLGGAHSRNA